MKIGSGKNKNLKLIIGNLKTLVFSYWNNYYKYCFYTALIFVSLVSFYFCYAFLYKFEWSEAQKKQYILSKERNVEFREKQFREIIELLSKKKTRYNGEYKPVEDIFQPYN